MAHRDADHEDRSKSYQNADEQEQTFAKKEKTTVYISHPTYPLIKAEAEAQRYSVKEYINKILEQHLEKQEFLSKVVPDLSLDSLDYEINKLVIKDCYTQDTLLHLTTSIDYENTTTYQRPTVKLRLVKRLTE